MAEEEQAVEQAAEEREPWQQVFFDDIFLLILAGLVVPTIFYLVWGLWSISNVPFFDR